MKVKELLINYDDRLFEYLIIEFRINNWKTQTIESKSYDDFMAYSKFKDCEVDRWFIAVEKGREKLIIDIKKEEVKE